MPKEIRAILFTADEVRSVVDYFLQKESGGRKVQPVERVELEIVKGALQARATVGRGADAKPTTLRPQDLMTAILMYCGYLRIPLSTRALKQLEAVSSGLMLTMSLNQDAAPPRINGNAVEYTAALPDTMKDAVATVRD